MQFPVIKLTVTKWSFCALSLLCSIPPLCLSFDARSHPCKATPHLILSVLYTEVTTFLFCRVFSDAASRTMPCTHVHGRGTAWSTEPIGTAANTVVCRSAWRLAWAVMVSASLNVKLPHQLNFRVRALKYKYWTRRAGSKGRCYYFCDYVYFLYSLFGFNGSLLQKLVPATEYILKKLNATFYLTTLTIFLAIASLKFCKFWKFAILSFYLRIVL